MLQPQESGILMCSTASNMAIWSFWNFTFKGLETFNLSNFPFSMIFLQKHLILFFNNSCSNSSFLGFLQNLREENLQKQKILFMTAIKSITKFCLTINLFIFLLIGCISLDSISPTHIEQSAIIKSSCSFDMFKYLRRMIFPIAHTCHKK